MGSIVDQDVDPAELGDSFFNDSAAMCGMLDVAVACVWPPLLGDTVVMVLDLTPKSAPRKTPSIFQSLFRAHLLPAPTIRNPERRDALVNHCHPRFL
jgi:hypothetical protein